MPFEAKQSIEGKENISDIDKRRNQLIRNIQNVTKTEKNKTRADEITKFAPKLVDLFSSFHHVPDVSDLLMINPDTQQTVLQDTIASLKTNYLQSFNIALDPKHPNFAKSQGKLSSFFEKKIKEKHKQAEENKKQAEGNKKIAEGIKEIAENKRQINTVKVEKGVKIKKEIEVDKEIAETEAKIKKLTDSQSVLKTKYADKIKTSSDIASMDSSEKEALATQLGDKSLTQLTTDFQTQAQYRNMREA